jgi:peptide/nickel transport system substrate-binding protein
MRRGVRIALCAALTMSVLPAAGQTLQVAVSSPVTSIDPHYHNLAPNISLSTQIFNRLIETDEHAQLVPGLAASWKLVAPDTWEIKLRDAKFQNGNEFVADDVVFTMERIPKVPNSPSNFAPTPPVTSTEIVDPHTIDCTPTACFAAADLPGTVFIINRKSDEGLATEDFNSGKAAIGTGPFRFVSFKPGDRVELERNDSYWGPKPVWQKITYRFIANDASRSAALLAGDVDFIDFVPTVDLAKLGKDPKVKLWEALGLRLIFLALDHSRDGPSPFVTGADGRSWTRTR